MFLSTVYAIAKTHVFCHQSTLFTLMLIVAAFGNAAYLFSRTRKYHFHRKQEMMSSPNAKFVSKEWDQLRAPTKALWKRGLSVGWRLFVMTWRFLLNLSPPQTLVSPNSNSSKVQELEVWTPGDLELQLFSLYSPVHAFLWLATNGSNWIMMLISMGLLTITVRCLNI
jgi:hypothetical protein